MLITNQPANPSARRSDRYALRTVIDNAISDAGDFFHTNALNCATPLHTKWDAQLAEIASVLYRLSGIHVDRDYEDADGRTAPINLYGTSTPPP